MRTAILKIIAEKAEVLNRLSNIAQMLPESGPNPWSVSDERKGEIKFSGPHQVDRVFAAFGGPAGWRKKGSKFHPAIDYIKQLENGVTVVIENAEAVMEIDEPLQVPSLS